MVFFLVFDIHLGFIVQRLTNRKTGISTLPCKLFVMGSSCFYPSATVSFNFFYQSGQRNVLGHHTQNMNMVVRLIYHN